MITSSADFGEKDLELSYFVIVVVVICTVTFVQKRQHFGISVLLLKIFASNLVELLTIEVATDATSTGNYQNILTELRTFLNREFSLKVKQQQASIDTLMLYFPLICYPSTFLLPHPKTLTVAHFRKAVAEYVIYMFCAK